MRQKRSESAEEQRIALYKIDQQQGEHVTWQVKFSVMSPGVHVWPHCGPTNCRVRAHLGLVVPEGPRIRVVNETR